MAAGTQARQSALRARLIDIAEVEIAAHGMGALRARSLAAEAKCSVGAIYNVFEDMNALVMAVNGRTFQALGATVTEAVLAAGAVSPQDRLIVMSKAYLAYAGAHTHKWRALFDLEMTVDGPAPEWYLKELGDLFAHIAGPMREIFPGASDTELDLRVRSMFSAVHGIVLLGLERRISAVPYDEIEQMIALLLGELG